MIATSDSTITFLAWAGLAGTIIGILLSAYFYFRGRRVKKPSFAMRSFNLVQDLTTKVDSVQVLYDGSPVKTLTATKVAFWNAGDETIRRSDVPEADALRFRAAPDCQILDAKIIQSFGTASECQLAMKDDGEVWLTFAFLDRGQGVVAQLLHTGRQNQPPSFLGSIIGAGPPKRREVNEWVQSFAAFLLLVPVAAGLVVSNNVPYSPFLTTSAALVTGVLVAWPTVLVLQRLTRGVPKRFRALVSPPGRSTGK
jgi:hypothetical protein